MLTVIVVLLTLSFAPLAPCASGPGGELPAERFRRCLADAEQGIDLGARARAQREVVRIGSERHESASTRDLSWASNAGADIVFDSTATCGRHAGALPPDEARELLGACIALLDRHLELLAQLGAQVAASTVSTRAALVKQRDALVPAPVVAPPAASAPTGPRPVPSGTRVGLGLGVGLGLAGLVAVIAGDRWGRRVYDDIAAGERDTVELRGPRALVVGGAVALGLGVALTSVFSARLVRARRGPTSLRIAPGRGGLVLGATFRF